MRPGQTDAALAAQAAIKAGRVAEFERLTRREWLHRMEAATVMGISRSTANAYERLIATRTGMGLSAARRVRYLELRAAGAGRAEARAVVGVSVNTARIWDGPTDAPRPRTRREAGAKNQVAECGTPTGYKRHRRLGEDACGPCRAAHSASVLRADFARQTAVAELGERYGRELTVREAVRSYREEYEELREAALDRYDQDAEWAAVFAEVAHAD